MVGVLLVGPCSVETALVVVDIGPNSVFLEKAYAPDCSVLFVRITDSVPLLVHSTVRTSLAIWFPDFDFKQVGAPEIRDAESQSRTGQSR